MKKLLQQLFEMQISFLLKTVDLSTAILISYEKNPTILV